MRIINRTISFILIFGLLVTSFLQLVLVQKASADNISDDIAYVVFGKRVNSQYVSQIQYGSTDPHVATKGGRDGWILDVGDSRARTIGLVLDEDFKPLEFDGSEYEVQIDYYDGGKGYFRLAYDEYNILFENSAGYTYVNDEQRWKTATYTLTNAEFKKEVDGKYDLLIGVDCPLGGSTHSVSDSSVTIAEIRVIKKPNKNAVFINSKTNEDGNSYEWYKESKLIYNTYENFTNHDIEVNLHHKLYTDDGFVVLEKDETIFLAKDEKKEATFDFSSVDRCDKYNYKVTVTDSTDKVISDMKSMELSVIKTDPNGILNKDQYWAAHLSYLHENNVSDPLKRSDITDMAVRVMKKANSGGIRTDVPWETFEPQPGVYEMRSNMIPQFTAAKKYGLDFIPQLNSGHPFYTGRYDVYAQTDEQFEALSRAVKWLVREYDEYFTAYEILNEPTIRGFNRYWDSYAGPELCMKTVNVIAQAIKEEKPEKFVWGITMCELMMERAQTYFREMVETGELDKYIDGMSIHPYANGPPEVYPIYDDYMKPYYIDVLEEHGIHDFPLFFSEIGHTSGMEWSNSNEKVGYLNQRTMIYYKTLGIGMPMALYNFEHKGPIKTNREDMFGNVSSGYDKSLVWGSNFVPDLSYLMVAGMNYVLADSETVKEYTDKEKNIWMTKFKSNKFDTNILSLYSVNDAKVVTLNLGTDKVTVFDHLGNEQTVYGHNGIFTFRSDDRPKFILGEINEPEILDNTHVFNCSIEAKEVATDDITVLDVYNYTGINCDYDIIIPESAELVNVEKVNDSNKTSIYVKNKAPVDSLIKVFVNMTDDSKNLISSTEFEIVSKYKVFSSLSFEMTDSRNVNRWNVTLNVKNNSLSNAIRGAVYFTQPEELKNQKPVDIGLIPKGREGQVSINIPYLKKKGRRLAEYTIKLSDGTSVDFAQQYDTSLAVYAHKKPSIDGKIDPGEWNTNAAMYADSIEQAIPIAGRTWSWGGIEDCSGRSVVQWDEEYIYIMAEVTDNVFKNNYKADSLWMGDSMQFGVSYNDTGYTALGEGYTTFHEIGLALCSDGPVAYRFMAQDGSEYKAGVVGDCDVAVVRNGSKTIYEFKMPWNKLLNPGQQIKEGSNMRYSFLFNDNDGNERVGYMECGSGIGGAKNASQFMNLQLVK